MLNAFPKKCANDVKAVSNFLQYDSHGYHNGVEQITVGNETISMPYRIYYFELTDLVFEVLTESQKRLLYCYFLCHHDGYVRHKYLKKIIESNKIYDYELPYIVSLIGSYVIEISEEIYNHFDLLIDSGLDYFICDNTLFIKKVESRIASYWGEYFKSISKEKYFGFKIQKYFKDQRFKC